MLFAHKCPEPTMLYTGDGKSQCGYLYIFLGILATSKYDVYMNGYYSAKVYVHSVHAAALYILKTENSKSATFKNNMPTLIPTRISHQSPV